MKLHNIFSTFILTLILFLFCSHSIASQYEEDRLIKLNKTLRCDTLADAKMSLTDRLLSPPINLGAKRELVHAKLGNPKETFGFGTEFYDVKDANITVSYTTDDKGDTVANLVEFRPKKDIPWSNWLKPTVQLPKPASYDPKSKKFVRLTVQIRIEDIGENRGLHLTLIGNQEAVSFINWSLIL